MVKKLSERKLLLAVILLVSGLVILFNVKLFKVPVQVSELALGLSAMAIALIFFSIKLFNSSIKNAQP